MCWEAVPETNGPNPKMYLHKSYLERYVHNFSGLPLVVLLITLEYSLDCTYIDITQSITELLLANILCRKHSPLS